MVARKNAQMRIQQMAFMIVGVFFFFILVGLFFVGWQYKTIMGNYENLQKEQAVSSLKVISDMVELNCADTKTLCLDADKLNVMSKKTEYKPIWPVSSIKVYKLYPADKIIKCPAYNCNYYEIYNSGQTDVREFSTFVNICQRNKENLVEFDKCEIGKLSLGVKLA